MPDVYTIFPLQKILTAVFFFINLTDFSHSIINNTNVYCMASSKAKSNWINFRDSRNKCIISRFFENVMKHFFCLNKSRALVVCGLLVIHTSVHPYIVSSKRRRSTCVSFKKYDFIMLSRCARFALWLM